ncbi:MAG: YacL family protein [Colwellia sp.]|nr:YacL family protein [Colwellia sp.]
MEYEFINDPITRYAKAKFSLEHEVFGPWLEVEVGNNPQKLTSLLNVIDKADHYSAQEQEIIGSEYTVRIIEKDVSIASNASLNGFDDLPEALSADDIEFDEQESASCGLEDFRTLLLSWARFTTH